MKKSDVAIYISAILTLVLTTFVVFSTQKVSYESKADEVLKNNNLATNQFAMAADKNTSSDVNSPLFRNKVHSDESTDETAKTESKTSDIRDITTEKKHAVPETQVKSPAPKKSEEPESVSTRTSKDTSLADITVSNNKSETRSELFDDEAPTANVKAPLSQNTPANTTETVATTAKKTAQTGVSHSHTVQYGDMLRTIAAQHGTTTLKLIQLNNLSNPDLIYPGQIIRLP